MADEDEIDILGEFSFNSCLAQNSQGIPSCSSREDTVHPQWLLDSVSANWYDQRDGPSRRLTGTGKERQLPAEQTIWSEEERQLLVREMAKYGRNVRKISQTIKSKTEAEIQALIEAEFGVLLDTPLFGLDRQETDDIPAVAQEEIVTEDSTTINNVLSLVTIASPTVPQIKTKTKPNHKIINKNNKNSLLKPNILNSEDKLNTKTPLAIDPSQILYEDDLMIGSTESVGSNSDPIESMMQTMTKQQRAKVRKLGNHRRKVSRNFDREKRNKSKELVKSPARQRKDSLKSPARQRKDSGMSDDSTKSPKLQIVLGSGQALPVSEGEQVIKIEKKQASDSESDIEIDVDSDKEDRTQRGKDSWQQDRLTAQEEEPIAVPLTFEPMPRRQKKINLDGDGGLTIMHTSSGDLFSRGAEPKKERVHKPRPIPLIPCKHYSKDIPAPFEVHMYVSALVHMDGHAHSSHAEVMGLVGGAAGGGAGRRVSLTAYCAARASASGTHCDMDPVSQASAAEHLSSLGLSVCAWHHSHPRFPPEPSALDLMTQRTLQRALERDRRPLLGIITSQHWPPGRTASQYRCIRIEDPDDDSEIPTGYQFSVKLVPDLTADSLPPFLHDLHTLLRQSSASEHGVRMDREQCPQAKCTYLDKYLSSVTHHMRSAGYRPDEPVIERLLQGIRDVFR